MLKLAFVLIKNFFRDLSRLLQFCQTFKKIIELQIFFEILPVRKLKKVENQGPTLYSIRKCNKDPTYNRKLNHKITEKN